MRARGLPCFPKVAMLVVMNFETFKSAQEISLQLEWLQQRKYYPRVGETGVLKNKYGRYADPYEARGAIWIALEIILARAWQARPRDQRIAADDDRWREMAFRKVAEPRRPRQHWHPKGDWPCPRCPGALDMINVGKEVVSEWKCDKCGLEMYYNPVDIMKQHVKFYDQGKEVSQYDIVLSTIFGGQDGSAALDGAGRELGSSSESIDIPDYSDAFFEGLSAAAAARAAEASPSGV